MGRTPRASARASDGRSRACKRLGGAAAAALAGVRELGWLGCTTAKTTRIAERGGGFGAHRGSRRPDCAAQRTGDEVVRRSRAALVEEGAAGLLRASGWHGSMPGVTVKQVEGSAGSGVPRRRGNRLAEPLTGGEVVGEIRRVQGPRSRKEASVMLLESRRGFCAAPMGLRCGRAA